MLIAHFVTSHTTTLSQPDFVFSPFYAACHCYQYRNVTDAVFRVVQNNAYSNPTGSDTLDYNF